uniref:Uncharacterized protein n=1 Tax=Terrapene triunguis TaxID=2587831 RepID=A0A674JDC6_9SAUR
TESKAQKKAGHHTHTRILMLPGQAQHRRCQVPSSPRHLAYLGVLLIFQLFKQPIHPTSIPGGMGRGKATSQVFKQREETKAAEGGEGECNRDLLRILVIHSIQTTAVPTTVSTDTVISQMQRWAWGQVANGEGPGLAGKGRWWTSRR